MFKEAIITIFIVIFVITGNIITQGYTKNTVNVMQEKLVQIKEEINNNNEDKINSKMNEIEEEWKKRTEILSYYLEHDELEKIETEIVILKANIQIEEYKQGMEGLENCYFLLEHIKDKESVKLDNIF